MTARPTFVAATPKDDLFVQLGRRGYRILRADGRPTSPIMRLDSDFYDIGAGFEGGFVVTVYVENPEHPEAEGEPRVLHVDLQGRVFATRSSQRVQPLGPGDVTVRSAAHGIDVTLGYRPSTRTTFAFPAPVKTLWQRDDRGWLWSCPNRGGLRGVVWWSKDGARSWHTTRFLLRTDRGPSRRWTLDCRMAGGQIAMLGYLDDLPTGYATGSFQGQASITMPMRPLDRRLNSYAADVLPDGRLVFGTSRPGLQVADSRAANTFTFEPGPIRTGTQVRGRTSDSLVWAQGHHLYLSREGRTWLRIDPT